MSRADRIAATEAHDFAHPREPLACPKCLRDLRPDPTPHECLAPALRIALRDVLDASLETEAMEVVPRRLWLALRRADDLMADIDGIPF